MVSTWQETKSAAVEILAGANRESRCISAAVGAAEERDNYPYVHLLNAECW